MSLCSITFYIANKKIKISDTAGSLYFITQIMSPQSNKTETLSIIDFSFFYAEDRTVHFDQF